MEIYLSRLLLNSRNSEVRQDLADCHRLHCTVLRAFPGVVSACVKPRKYYGVLYRVELHRKADFTVLYVQSRISPNWAFLSPGYVVSHPEYKNVGDHYAAMKEGMVLRFRLKVNPTKKVGTTLKADRVSGVLTHNGHRIPISRPADQIEWLRRKGLSAGFELLSLTGDLPEVGISVSGLVSERGLRPRGSSVPSTGDADQLVFRGVTYDGYLRIIESRRFIDALTKGIGSGKAYGFGLLSVARVM